MRPNLINRLKEEWNNLDPVDPLRGLIADAIDALAEQPARASKPWVGLTELEVGDFKGGYQSGRIGSFVSLVAAIEAKLREKNAQPSKPHPLTGILSIARHHPDGRVVTVSFKTKDAAIAFERYALDVAYSTKEQP